MECVEVTCGILDKNIIYACVEMCISISGCGMQYYHGELTHYY